jgi:hypothetical protein
MRADRDGRDRNEMERPMLQQPNVRRRQNGSIDLDFYRRQAAAERRLAIAEFVRGVARLRGGMIAAIVLAAGLYVASQAGTNASATPRHESAVAL